METLSEIVWKLSASKEFIIAGGIEYSIALLCGLYVFSHNPRPPYPYTFLVPFVVGTFFLVSGIKDLGYYKREKIKGEEKSKLLSNFIYIIKGRISELEKEVSETQT